MSEPHNPFPYHHPSIIRKYYWDYIDAIVKFKLTDVEPGQIARVVRAKNG